MTSASDLPLGVKVAAALCAANRKTGQAVFEDLFKAEEFDDALVDRGVKAQAALVGADGVIELDAEATVDMQPALIVRPGNPELDHAVRLDQTVQNARGQVDRMRLHDRLQRGEDLPHRLMKFRLTGISFFHLRQQCLQILVFHVRSSAFSQKNSAQIASASWTPAR